MFANNQNVETLRQIGLDLKEYVALQSRSAQLTLIEKLTIAASAAVLGAILFVLSAFVLLFLSATGAALLAPHVGGMAAACAIVAALYAVGAVTVYAKRRTWIIDPLATFFANLVLDLRHKATNNEKTPL